MFDRYVKNPWNIYVYIGQIADSIYYFFYIKFQQLKQSMIQNLCIKQR